MTYVSYTCLKNTCGKRVAAGIECDVCNRWAHKICSNIPNKLFKLYSEHTNLIWVCGNCRELAKQALKGQSVRELTQEPYQHSTTTKDS